MSNDYLKIMLAACSKHLIGSGAWQTIFRPKGKRWRFQYIERLQMVIQHLHKARGVHMHTAPVHEVFNGQTVWQGDVELFALMDHPKAKLCYAWSYKDDSGGEHFAAILGLPPVQTPLDAVKVFIASQVKKAKG